jgi:hypothetical protein
MGLKFQHFLIFNFFGDFFENFSILEVEIGRNGPGILGVNQVPKRSCSTTRLAETFLFLSSWNQGFFRLHVARKHPKKFPCYKRYKNSRNFLDEKAKCQS